MNSIINTIKVASHLDHILHPFTLDKGLDKPTLNQRIAGIAALVFLTVLTVGCATPVYLYLAHRKWMHKTQQALPSTALPINPAPNVSPASLQSQTPPTAPTQMPPQIRRIETTEQDNHLLQQMEKVWKDHIQSFKIRHFTTALFHHHFKTHGISAAYPEALHSLIGKIRKLWHAHEKEIPLTEYFANFEKRYVKAIDKKKVTVSFSCSSSMCVTEFTSPGVRLGGEWLKEARTFIRHLDQTKLTPEEKRTVLEVKTYDHVIAALPAMAVKVQPGCPDLANNHSLRNGLVTFSLDNFQQYVMRTFSNWRDPDALSAYLNQIVINEIKENQKYLERQYEITINEEIKPENLEFEFINGKKRVNNEQSLNYPRGLPFDSEVFLTTDEVCSLDIAVNTGFSTLTEYQDSKFHGKFLEPNKYSIIRRKRVPEDTLFDDLCKDWLKAFGGEHFMQEYAI